MKWRGKFPEIDWDTIAEVMKEVESTHSAVVTFTVSLLGEQYQHRFLIHVVISTTKFSDSGQLLCCEVSKEWPNGDHQTMPAQLYELLLKGDVALTRCYEQTKIVKA